MTIKIELKDNTLDAIWNYIKQNPEVSQLDVMTVIGEKKNILPTTVRTLIKVMVSSSVLIKEYKHNVCTLRINDVFSDVEKALRFNFYYRKEDINNEEKLLRGYFLDDEIEEVKRLRIKVFLETDQFMRIDKLFIYLMKFHHETQKRLNLQDNILNHNFIPREVPKPSPADEVIHEKHRELPITMIESERIDKFKKDLSKTWKSITSLWHK